MKNKFSFIRTGGSKIVFCMTLMCALIFSSCNRDENVALTATRMKSESADEYLQRRMSMVSIQGKTFKVEHATLDEINKLMKEEGLPELTRCEVQKTLQKRTVYPCYVWVNHGDYNYSGTFTAYDLVLARSYICSFGDCNGTVNIWQGTHPSAAIDFAFLSWLANGADDDLLNPDDTDIGASFILGLINCN